VPDCAGHAGLVRTFRLYIVAIYICKNSNIGAIKTATTLLQIFASDEKGAFFFVLVIFVVYP